jgi:hypothetical protein
MAEVIIFEEKGRCSRCGKLRSENELNGINPFTRPGPFFQSGGKYRRAYCRNIAECDSVEADQTIKKFLRALND